MVLFNLTITIILTYKALKQREDKVSNIVIAA